MKYVFSWFWLFLTDQCCQKFFKIIGISASAATDYACTLLTCHNMPESGQYQAHAASIHLNQPNPGTLALLRD